MARPRRASELLRVNLYMGKAQHERMFKISEKTGISVAELCRRALDLYLQRYVDTGKT